MPRKWGYVLLGCAAGTLLGLFFWARDHYAARNHKSCDRPAVTQYTSHHAGEPPAVPAREEVPPSRPALLPLNNLAEAPAPRPLPTAEVVQVSGPPPEVAGLPPREAPTPPEVAPPSVPVMPPEAPVAATPVPAPPMVQPVAVSAPPSMPTPPTTIACPWIVKLEIVEGRSRLEARTETGVYLKISCDRLQLKSPDGNIEAVGNVSFLAGSLEGSCDTMALTWSDSKISLVGKVKLKGRQEEQDVDLNGDSLSFRLQPTKMRRDPAVLPASATVPAAAPPAWTPAPPAYAPPQPVAPAAPPQPVAPPPSAFPPPNFNPPAPPPPPVQDAPPPAPAPTSAPPAPPPAPLSPAPINQGQDQPTPPVGPGATRNDAKPGVAIAESQRKPTTPPAACVAEVVILADGTRVTLPQQPQQPAPRVIAGR